MVRSFKKDESRARTAKWNGLVEKDIIGGKCDAIHRYVKTSNKYMKDYNKNKESSYVKYWDTNDL